MSDEQQTAAATATEAAAPIVVDMTDGGDGSDGSDSGGASHDELVAALRAGDPETEAVAATEATAVDPLAVTAETPAATPAANEPKIAAIIRAREEAQKKRQEAHDEIAQMRATAESEATKIRDEARAAAAREIEAEKARFVARYAESPLDAINQFGIPKDKLVDDVAREGTPEWRMMKRLEAERAADRKELDELKSWRAQQAAQAETQKTEQAKFARANAERQFLAQHASPEKAPALRKMPEAVVLTLAHKQADEWRSQGIPFADSDIAEYLEHQAQQWLGGSHQVESPSGNSAPKAKANGTRTLNALSGSERRASPKAYEDVEDDPVARKAYLLEAMRDGKP